MANWKKVIVSGSQAELNSLALDTALTVANGGTGASTLTDGGVLLGSGTGAITALGQATDGQLIIGDSLADPVVASLGVANGVKKTVGAGSLTVGLETGGTGNLVNAQTDGTGVTVASTDRLLISDQSQNAGTGQVSYIEVSQLQTAIGGGTVTSVAISGTDGIDVDSGSPITGAGTIALGLSNVPNTSLANSSVSYGGVSVALGGSDATPAFDLQDATGLPLTTGVSGILPIANGGTNISSYTTGDILYASSGTALAKLGIGSSGQILAVSSGGIVEWINNDEGDITTILTPAAGGLTITDGTGPAVTISVNLDSLTAAAVDVAADSIAIIDANASNGSRKESIADLATAMAGTGITATNGVLSATTGDVESIANDTNGGMEVTNGGGPDVTIAMDVNNLATATPAITDFVPFSDESATGDPTKKATLSQIVPIISGSILTNLTGDVSVTAAGVVSVNSVQANAVALGTDTTGNYVATLGSGTGVTIGSNTGEGSTPTIAVDYGTSANTAAEGNVSVTFAGTANEIELSQNTFGTIGGGGAVTIGLPNDVTIGNNLTVANNAIISGDLTVSGTASFTHSDNLDIADKFITLSSGSTTATDGGIIVAQTAVGSAQFGEAFGFNAQAGGAGRWGITGSLSNDAGAIVALDQMVTARSSTAAPSAAPRYGGTSGYGNMHIDTNNEDIYIYV